MLENEEDVQENEQIDNTALGDEWRDIADDAIDPDAEVLIEGVHDDLIAEYRRGLQPATDTLSPDQLSKEELIARMQQLEERNKAAKDQADYQALTQKNIQDMTSAITQAVGGRQAAPNPAPLPTETEEQFRERIRELHHDDPYRAQLEINQRQFAPLMGSLIANNVRTARSLLELDPREGPLMKRFASDVDRIVQSKPDWEKLQDPEIYRKALQQVKAERFDELVDERAKQIAEEGKKGVQNSASNTKLPTAPTSPTVRAYSVANYNPAPRGEGGQRKILGTLTPAEKRKAFVLGIPDKQYYMFLKQKGLKP